MGGKSKVWFVNCSICDEPIRMTPCQEERGKKYCSMKCKRIGRRKQHKIIDGVIHKECWECKKWHTLDNYTKGSSWDKLSDKCKNCELEYRTNHKAGIRKKNQERWQKIKPKYTKRVCLQCRKVFTSNRKNKLYCSGECYKKNYQQENKKILALKKREYHEKNRDSRGIAKQGSPEHHRKLREATIKKIKKQKFNGLNICPATSPYEKPFLDKIENLVGKKIKRQYPVIGYFLDGYCEELNLAIEIDEKYHRYQEERDKQRELDIKNELGCRFLRIPLYKNAI